MDFGIALNITLFMVSVYCIINSLEILAVSRGHIPLVPNGVYESHYPGPVSRLFALATPNGFPSMFGSAHWLVVAACMLRLVCAIGTMAAVVSGLFPWQPFLVALTALTLFVNYARPVGGDGAMQMGMVVMLSITLATLLGATPELYTIAAIFIVAQSTLAYFAAAVSKSMSPTWRKGGVVAKVVTTEAYGGEFFANFFRRHPVVGKIGTYSVIAVQFLFPLWIILPDPLLFALIAVFIGFHSMLAISMNLNDFPWTFLAPYPLILHFGLNGTYL